MYKNSKYSTEGKSLYKTIEPNKLLGIQRSKAKSLSKSILWIKWLLYFLLAFKKSLKIILQPFKVANSTDTGCISGQHLRKHEPWKAKKTKLSL